MLTNKSVSLFSHRSDTVMTELLWGFMMALMSIYCQLVKMKVQ